jgi:choline dehydrogenase-like flavoprotein
VSVSSLDSGFSDIVVVGGGIAGATIALVLARAGLTVTVLEQQPSYHDRVRGEYIQRSQSGSELIVGDAKSEVGAVGSNSVPGSRQELCTYSSLRPN